MEIKMAKQAKKTIKKETKATETEVLKEVVSRRTWDYTKRHWNDVSAPNGIYIYPIKKDPTEEEEVIAVMKAIKSMIKKNPAYPNESELMKSLTRDGFSKDQVTGIWEKHKQEVLDMLFDDLFIEFSLVEYGKSHEQMMEIKSILEGDLPAKPKKATRKRTPKSAHISQMRQALTGTINSKKSSPKEIADATKLLASIEAKYPKDED